MAGIYIVLALVTAVFFLLTRKSKLTVTKHDRLVIRIDLVFLGIQLTEKEKPRKKKRKKKKSSPEFRKRLIFRIKELLSKSELEVKKFCIGDLFIPKIPSQIPYFYLGKTPIYALLALVSAYSKSLTLSPDALSRKSEDEPYFHFVLRAPLIILLHSIFLIRLDKIRTERRLNKYVGDENG